MSRKKPKPRSRFMRFLRGLMFTVLALFAAFVALVVYIIVTDDDPNQTPEVSPTVVATVTAEADPTIAPTEAPTPTAEPTVKPTATVSPTATPLSYAELSRGSKGDKVRQLQERLNELGYSVGTADGAYGAKTVNGVSAFQRSAELDETGVATPETQAALYSPDAPRAPVSATQKPTATKEPSRATERPTEPDRPSDERPVVTEKPTEATKEPVVTEVPKPTKKPESSGGNDSSGESGYIGNSNTHKFHKPSCPSVDDMNPEHRVSLSSRDKAISSGYDPCGRCHP